MAVLQPQPQRRSPAGAGALPNARAAHNAMAPKRSTKLCLPLALWLALLPAQGRAEPWTPSLEGPDCRHRETCLRQHQLQRLRAPEQPAAAPPPPAHVVLNLSAPLKAISPGLFGIFFEEVQHGGEGGLYAELVQDRGFEGLAFTSGFAADQQGPKDMTQYLHEWPLHVAVQSTDPKSWALGRGTSALLSRAEPNSRGNPTYLTISAGSGTASVRNHGFWGIAVRELGAFELTLAVRADSACQGSHVRVALEAVHGAPNTSATLAEAVLAHVPAAWSQQATRLIANASSDEAMLVIEGQPGCSLSLDMVSLFPAENGPLGSISPFRQDLLALLQGLHPKFVRMPGGCYVEGTLMSNGFFWKPSAGPLHERPGHWNGQWAYWSTDGLGLHEYLLLAEALGAQPLWVTNNGLSHGESVPTARVGQLVQDALDAIEYIMGPSDSVWGARRAAAGHPAPWKMSYLGIGNEDCGKPYYTSNYLAFFFAIRQAWPQLRLVANCDMGRDAPTQLYDWHWYTSATALFHARSTFDAAPRDGPGIFMSEAAVFDWEHQPVRPLSNMENAVAEAGFWTGLERNGDIVRLASFAPLLCNSNHTPVCAPGNLVVFDNRGALATPSYHVQALFAQAAGPWLVASDADIGASGDLAVSATCSDAACARLTCKIVNWSSHDRRLNVSLPGLPRPAALDVVTLAGKYRLDTNTLKEPHKVRPVTELGVPEERLQRLAVPATSLTILELRQQAGSTAQF